jgi:hypothetical protein
MLNKELLDELKQILEEDYNVKLSDNAVAKTAKFLVSYFGILQKMEEQE